MNIEKIKVAKLSCYHDDGGGWVQTNEIENKINSWIAENQTKKTIININSLTYSNSLVILIYYIESEI